MAAYIWILGEFAQHIRNSPYIIEAMLPGIMEKNEGHLTVNLLFACLKLIFKKAPESKHLLA